MVLFIQETQNIDITLLVLHSVMRHCYTVHLTLDSNLDKGVQDNQVVSNTLLFQCDKKNKKSNACHNAGQDT